MDPNILLTGAPSTVEVGGVSVPIDTSWRTGIYVLKTIDNPNLGEKESIDRVLRAYFMDENDLFPKIVVDNIGKALRAVQLFLNFNEPKRPKIQGTSVGESKLRRWDWDWDAQRLIADFDREYQINLVDPTLEMHWWEFWSRYLNLSDTSATMRAISIRATEETKDMSADEKRRLRKQKAAVLLPARTEEEAKRLTEFVWSIDV